MSDKDAKKNKTEVQEKPEKEKVMTKYDRKMQRREEAKRQEEKEKRIGRIAGIACVIVLAALVAYFPIRRYVDMHEVYVTIGGEDVARAEFDYNYNLVMNNYIGQYGSYLSYFGLDLSRDLSTQMYTEDLTWKDYFEQMTVESMTSSKALKAAADEAGFVYDASGEVKEFQASIKEKASEAGVSSKKYLRELYGNYATMSNISSYLEEAVRENKYYEQVAEGKAASDEEIRAYYEENKESYDSVDYYVSTFEAQLPTAPTELADPVTESSNAAVSAGDGAETAYQPSAAEIAKAMEDAKKLADAANAVNGELRENVKRSSAPTVTWDWLFDDARKQGDTTVIEDTSNNQYYVLSFVKRYLDESATANLRVIMDQDIDGQAILSEWAAGAATEDSFAELCTKYSADSGALVDGGLLEGVARTGIAAELGDWIFAEGRAAGDTTAITTGEGYTYVMYYVGEGDPEWKNSIADTLLSNTMSAYMEEISAGVTVEDRKGKLNYLKVQEAAAAESGEAADASAESAENTGEAESSQAQ